MLSLPGDTHSSPATGWPYPLHRLWLWYSSCSGACANFSCYGVDISEVQIARAESLVPDATFLCEDITSVSLPPHTFEAIASFFAIIHVPLQEQQPLFEKIFKLLKPGGYFMATVGHKAWTGYETTDTERVCIGAMPMRRLI